MLNGWIKLHRQIIDWEWYDDANTFRLFIHLLLLSNHKENKWHGTTIKRGQCIVGRKELSKKLRISQQSIRTSLTRLKSTNEITSKSTNKFSIITIINWEQYQDKETKSTSKSTKSLTNNQPATNQQLTTPKECKNEKNDKNLKDGTTLTLKDRTKAVKRFGIWVLANNTNVPINISHYPELRDK